MENNWQAEWELEVKVSGHAIEWLPCQAQSDIQGFGQVQIKTWPQHGSFKDKKLRPARPVKEADEDTPPHMHYLLPQDQHHSQCKLPPGSSRDSTAVTWTPTTQAGATSGTGGMLAAGWHLPLPDWQQAVELN